MPFCARCGEAYEGNPSFCPKCGFNLQVSAAAAQPFVGQDQKAKGLDNLKNSFLLYLIAGMVTLIPIINLIGAILQLVALISLILGWRALGRSTLLGAPEYKSAGKWLVYAIVIIFVGATVGIVLFVASVMSSIFASVNPVSASNPFLQGSGFRNLIGGFFLILVVADVAWLFAWYKVSFSMRTLAHEVSQPRVATAGWLFLLNAVIGFVSLSLLAVGSYTATLFPYATTPGSLSFLFGSYSYLFSGSVGALFFLISLVGTIALVLASYRGYVGLKAAQR